MADAIAQAGSERSTKARFRHVSVFAILSTVWLLLACDVGGDPQRRARFEADDARCERMADSMVAAARATGRNVASDEYEPARMSCMTYRGWKDGKFR
jgi:hypothetical protein